MRYALGIEYDGTGYCGWQFQNDCLSVQECVETALSRVASHAVKVVCAGRTDAGVHALQQVVHFDTDAQRDLQAWTMGVNTYLPAAIRVLWVQQVSAAFHARRSAIARSYRYGIINRQMHSALDRERLCWYNRPLNVEIMQQAAQHLIGEHDFSSFRGHACQSKSPWRLLHVIDVQRDGEQVWITIIGNAFLHHMVRNIVGVLLATGSGLKPAAWVAEVLAAKDRKQAGVTASAAGLYFSGIFYPAEFGLPKLSEFNQLPVDLKRIEYRN